MKRKFGVPIVVVLLALACKPGNQSAEEMTLALRAAAVQTDPVVVQKYCYACHNPSSPSHDQIIAPPLAAVRIRYKRMYKTEKDFVAAMTAFLQNPSDENAIMFGAKQRFGLMPKVVIEDSALEEIVKYLYAQKPAEPAWFNEHMKEMEQ